MWCTQQSQAWRWATHCRVELHGLHLTLKSSSTVCIPPWSQAPQCVSRCRVKLCSVHHTPESSDPNFFKKLCGIYPSSESSSALRIPPQSQTPRYASYHWVKFSSVHHTTESNYTPRSQNLKFCWSLVSFKGTIRRNSFRGEHFYHKRKYLKYKKSFFLKGDLRPQFFSWFERIWAPDKQAKVFFTSVSISPRYLITKFKKFDSGVYHTAESKF